MWKSNCDKIILKGFLTNEGIVSVVLNMLPMNNVSGFVLFFFSLALTLFKPFGNCICKMG